MSRFTFLLLCLFSGNALFAQNDYSVFKLSPELLENANVVKRMEEVAIEIKDIGKATITKRYAITILNKAGDEWAEFNEHYDKLVSFKSVEGKLYDAMGKKIKSLKKSDIRDYSNTDENSLADDSRIKQHNFNYNSYPYTIEYESEIQFNGIFYLPRWIPVEGPHFAVEQSIFQVITPENYRLRYKPLQYPDKPEIISEKGKKMYKWIVKKYPAYAAEYLMPAGYEFTPAVFLAPADFQVQDYDGNMDDWKNYGKFIYRLNENRDQLPDNVKQDIHRITDPLTSNKEKIKAAYQYLQQNTRYISVQLGIGGWQTFDAKYVAQNKYGDCKALSNYMYALLKEAGIKSYYTLLHSSDNLNRVMPDFPSTQFNHAILCVPEGKDTTWLECTSQSYPPGYLGSSNSNRPVLLVDENGGQIVYTPRYSKIDNVQLRRITGVIDDNGELKAKVKTDYKAWQHEFYHAVMHELSREKMLEEMKERMDIPSFDINDFSYAEKKSSLPVVEESIDLTVHNFASKTGKRLFVNPNLMNRNNRSFDEQAKRKTNIKVMFGYTDSDSIVIDLPAGYKPESLPTAVNIESPFGKYSSTTTFSNGKIIYTRFMERNEGDFPASMYKEFAAFYNKIYKADRTKAVFVKEE